MPRTSSASMPRAGLPGTRLVHVITILGADVFEAGTLVCMTWRYDPPALGVVWALVIARDLSAPLYAVYLSLAQPTAVGARDVLHLVELAAGAGMARHAIRLAHDPHAPLARKAQLFVAASESANRTTQQDLERLEHLLEVLMTTIDVGRCRQYSHLGRSRARARRCSATTPPTTCNSQTVPWRILLGASPRQSDAAVPAASTTAPPIR